MPDRVISWTTTDPRGLTVSLAKDVWHHIVQAHPDIDSYFDAVKQTIEDPDEIYFDDASTRNRITGAQIFAYYKRRVFVGLLRTKILYVSVKFVPEPRGTQGYVQTAFPVRALQKRMLRVWSK